MLFLVVPAVVAQAVSGAVTVATAITAAAGNCTVGYAGDGAAATSAELNRPPQWPSILRGIFTLPITAATAFAR